VDELRVEQLAVGDGMAAVLAHVGTNQEPSLRVVTCNSKTTVSNQLLLCKHACCRGSEALLLVNVRPVSAAPTEELQPPDKASMVTACRCEMAIAMLHMMHTLLLCQVAADRQAVAYA
jgi:hypothetical protein